MKLKDFYRSFNFSRTLPLFSGTHAAPIRLVIQYESGQWLWQSAEKFKLTGQAKLLKRKCVAIPTNLKYKRCAHWVQGELFYAPSTSKSRATCHLDQEFALNILTTFGILFPHVKNKTKQAYLRLNKISRAIYQPGITSSSS